MTMLNRLLYLNFNMIAKTKQMMHIQMDASASQFNMGSVIAIGAHIIPI